MRNCVLSVILAAGMTAVPAVSVANSAVIVESLSSVAAGLTGATTEAEISAIVTAARDSGVSDADIAQAFGIAAVLSETPSILSAGFASFAASSSLDSGALEASYDAGTTAVSTTAQSGGAPVGGSALGFGGVTDVPTGGGASPK